MWWNIKAIGVWFKLRAAGFLFFPMNHLIVFIMNQAVTLFTIYCIRILKFSKAYIIHVAIYICTFLNCILYLTFDIEEATVLFVNFLFGNTMYHKIQFWRSNKDKQFWFGVTKMHHKISNKFKKKFEDKENNILHVYRCKHY